MWALQGLARRLVELMSISCSVKRLIPGLYNPIVMGVKDSVAAFIRREGLLQPGERLVVGVSGGADSLCLLDCLHRLGHELVVAHLDHGLRPSSAQEALRVGEIAAALDLPFESERVALDLRNQADSVEEAARIQRYRFLIRISEAWGIETIACGHTLDDQAETVLMHLLRGAGSSGLKGMLPRTHIADWVGIEADPELALVRPLLEIRRSETEAYCRKRGLEPVRDESNLDMRFFRNRLRHELLPILEGYNPRIREVLVRTAKVMAAEAEILQILVEKSWSSLVRVAGEASLALDLFQFREQPLALQRGLIRRAIRELRPNLRDVGFEAIETVRQVAEDPSLKRRSTVGEVECLDLGEELVLRHPGATISFPQLPQLLGMRAQELTIPGRIDLASRRAVTAAIQALDQPNLDEWTDRSPEQVALDAADLPQRLTIRPPQPGDRIRPLGMDGSLKVSDLFINCRVPEPARSRWPLVVAGDEVLWVVGLRISHRHRLSDESDQAVVLALTTEGS